MNSNNQRTVQHLLDAEWHVAIAEELTNNPAGIAFNVEPAAMGQYCAERGDPCEPTKYYRKLGDIENFVIAYNDTVLLWAEMVQDVNDAQDDGKVDFEAELMELLDGIDEAAWIRGGM
jgi:hypothetical protein